MSEAGPDHPKPKTVFLGTPEAAVPSLRMVAAVSEVAMVLTQPDRPRGRSGTPAPSPVKLDASELGLTVAQPETSEGLVHSLADAGEIDVAVVVAYGRILSTTALSIPKLGMLNLHFSLLPRWRGAAPVERALMAGDSMTGVTIIKLDEGLDTGPVLDAQAVDILPGENAGELTRRLAEMGARRLGQALIAYTRGGVIPTPQTGEGTTYASKLTSQDRPIDTTRTGIELVNQVRALAPSPAATVTIDQSTHKLLDVEFVADGPEMGAWRTKEGWPVIGVSDGGLKVKVLQPPGKRPMAGDDWARGRQVDGGRAG